MRLALRLVLTSAFATACGGPSLPIELTFPDTATRAATTGMVITAIEPFAVPKDASVSRVVVKCGEVGVFPPVTKYDRDGQDLSGVEHVLLNREYHAFPLSGQWSLDIPALPSSSDSNPWRAVLVHFEARGLAQAYDKGLGQVADATLVQGCFCVRLNENGHHPDKTLDDEVRAACTPVKTPNGSARAIVLASPATPEFRLEACGVKTLTAPKETRAAAGPSVCVRTTRCDQEPNGAACFNCTDTCPQLNDLRNVPIQTRILRGATASDPIGGIVLTDKDGRSVPEIPVGDCSAPFTVQASVLGRPDTAVNIDVNCVPSVKMAEQPATSLLETRLAALTSFPGAFKQGGGHQPARLALLRDADSGARLELFSAVGGSFSMVTSKDYRTETARGISGYYYKLGPKPEEYDRPLLAVATTSVAGAREQLKIRIYEWDDTKNDLMLVRTMGNDCKYCACGGPPTCGACNCASQLNLSSEASFSAADVDHDGFADLAVGVNTDFGLTTFYSAVTASSPAEDRLRPPMLQDHCECANFGKVLATFEDIRLGGPPPVSGQDVDLMIGDVSGAFVKYPAGNRVDGMACTPGMTACPAGTSCATLCPGNPDSARCVQRCDNAAPRCDASPTQNKCVGLSATASVSYCGGPALGCGQPNSVWQLVNIHNLAKGRFVQSAYEDAVAVGSGSPAPGFDDGGRIRLIFGDALDLTALQSAPASVRNQSFFDLVPRAFPNRGLPSGPRAVGVGDFNGDGIDDLAVLFVSSEEIHVWLGGGNRCPGEIEAGAKLSNCDHATCMPAERCAPFRKFVTGDFDGTGRSGVVAVCVLTSGIKLRWFKPVAM